MNIQKPYILGKMNNGLPEICVGTEGLADIWSHMAITGDALVDTFQIVN